MSYILLILGLINFIFYNGLMIYLNKGVLPESISDTAYIQQKLFSGNKQFTLFCIVSALCIFPTWIGITPDVFQFLVFLSCSGMIFAGLTPLFKLKEEGIIHYTSGVVAFITALIWLAIFGYWGTIISIATIGGIWTLFNKEKYTFIFEVVSYILLVITLMII